MIHRIPPKSILLLAATTLSVTSLYAKVKAPAVATAEEMSRAKKGTYSFATQPTAETEKRLEWFKEAKFGMMIDWGIYSPRGGIAPNGKPQRHGYTEWYQKANQMPYKEYSKLAGEFHPTKFDAEKWVKIAKNAGMKYITYIAKHHDGFCMFDSAYTKYDLVDATPFKHDALMDLKKACDKYGLKLCLYYSHCQDWEQFDAWNTSPWIYPELKGKTIDHEKYLMGKALPQVAELCIKYQPDGFWFDTPWFNRKKLDVPVSTRFSYLVRALAPNAIINSRIVHGAKPQKLYADLFDYISLGDLGLPSGDIPMYFESPDSITHSYGYDKRPGVKYRSADDIITRMILNVAGGGNYLLNVGPDGDGELPEQSVKILEEVSGWMKVNGKAIYGTEASPFNKKFRWGAVTRKDGKLYLFHTNSDASEISIPVDGKKFGSAYLLENGEKLPTKIENGKVIITHSKNSNTLPTVIVLDQKNN